MWIFRVYFLVACISPLLLSMYKRLGTGKFLLVLLAVYPVYELFVSYITAQTSLWAEAVELTVVYAVGYGFICGIGIVLHDTTRTARVHIPCLCRTRRRDALPGRCQCVLHSKIPAAHAVHSRRTSRERAAVAAL